MQEIKFRAWDTKRKVMMSGKPEKKDNGLFSVRSDGMIPEDYILMQFIGRIDWNGIDIYEGDIVFFRSKHLNFGVVVWNQEMCMFTINMIPFFPEKGYQTICHFWNNAGQQFVIGNVYENPDIAKGDSFLEKL